MEKIIKSARSYLQIEKADGAVENVLRTEEFFDSEGRKLKELGYDTSGVVESGIEWELNEKGKVVRELNMLGGEITEDKTLEYDDEGRIIKKTVAYNGGGMTITEVTYEKDKVTETSRDEDGELEERKISWINEKEYLEKEEVYDENNVMSKWTKNTFNEDDKVDIRVECDVADGFEVTRDYHYNDKGYLEGVVVKRNDKRIGSVRFEYDERGNRTSETHNGQLGITTTYDEKDRVIRTENKNLEHNAMESYSAFTFKDDLLQEEEHFTGGRLQVISFEYDFH